MQDAKYTPGPWFIKPGAGAEPYPNSSIYASAFPFENDYLATAHMPHPQEKVGGHEAAKCIAEANARLIAAAPDLLYALEMVRDADEDCRKDGLPTIPAIARAKIDAAIAKATAAESGGA